jgi:hypothetical protein
MNKLEVKILGSDILRAPALNFPHLALKWVAWVFLILMKYFKGSGKIFFRKSLNRIGPTQLPICPGYWLAF